jgi:hypothetical protein
MPSFPCHDRRVHQDSLDSRFNLSSRHLFPADAQQDEPWFDFRSTQLIVGMAKKDDRGARRTRNERQAATERLRDLPEQVAGDRHDDQNQLLACVRMSQPSTVGGIAPGTGAPQ